MLFLNKTLASKIGHFISYNFMCLKSCNRYEDLVAQTLRDKVELIEINVKLTQLSDMLVQEKNSLQMELNTLKKVSSLATHYVHIHPTLT